MASLISSEDKPKWPGKMCSTSAQRRRGKDTGIAAKISIKEVRSVKKRGPTIPFGKSQGGGCFWGKKGHIDLRRKLKGDRR